MQRHLLIINPNTSASVSETLRSIAVDVATTMGDGEMSDGETSIRVQTARLGASYISDEVTFAIAAHALLDAYALDAAQHPAQRPGAVLIGCFGDPGLAALQQLCPVPVLGLAQASMGAAHALGPYAVLTGGQAWVPMLERLISQLGFAGHLVRVQAVEKTGAELAAAPASAIAELTAQCISIVRKYPRVQSIVLGGAALGGMAEPIAQAMAKQGAAHVRLVDSVRQSITLALKAVQQPMPTKSPTAKQAVDQAMSKGISTLNLSAELQALLR
jgi:allantoin racemase